MIWFEIDVLKGVMMVVVGIIILFLIDKVMFFEEVMKSVFDGMKLMLYVLVIVVMFFVLKNVNDQFGLINYIIEQVFLWMNKSLLFVIVFLFLFLVIFVMGFFWGVYVIFLFIIVFLVQFLDVNIWLVIGLVVSVGVFGLYVCFYGDVMILFVLVIGCNNMVYVLIQLFYVLIFGVIFIIIFLLLGMFIVQVVQKDLFMKVFIKNVLYYKWGDNCDGWYLLVSLYLSVI